MRAIAIAALLAALLVPASLASASQVTYNGSVLTYNAAAGEYNCLGSEACLATEGTGEAK